MKAHLTPLGSIKGDTWERIYDVTLTEAATSLTISGLNGDVDEEYLLESKVVNGYNGACSCDLRLNNDSGANYGRQYFYGLDSAVTSARATTDTYLGTIGGGAALSDVNLSSLKLFAKTGFVRTAIHSLIAGIITTTARQILLQGSSWNNTADNITSLVIGARQTGGIGVGSSFQLYRKSRRSA